MGFNSDECNPVLQAIFDLSRANTKVSIPSTVIDNVLTIPHNTKSECLGYLESMGFIEILRPRPLGANFDLISISRKGLNQIEKNRSKIIETSVIESNYGNESNTIFISYSKNNYQSAKRLYDDLKSSGLNPWIDTVNLLPGVIWDNEIKKAIRNCRFFLPLLSNNAVNKRGYIQRELKLGIDTAEEIPDGQLFIIPLRLDECPVPSEKLSRIQYQDMFPNWDIAMDRIIKSIKSSISKIPTNPNISKGQETHQPFRSQIVKELKYDILSGVSLSISISKVLDSKNDLQLSPLDVVWLRNELYGYDFTDEHSKKNFINDEDTLPGNPDYRKIKGILKIQSGNSLNRDTYREINYPLFLGQPVSEIERMKNEFGKYQILMYIPITSLPKDQYEIMNEIAPQESRIPVTLTKIEIDRCLSQLRLRLHKLLSDVT